MQLRDGDGGKLGGRQVHVQGRLGGKHGENTGFDRHFALFERGVDVLFVFGIFLHEFIELPAHLAGFVKVSVVTVMVQRFDLTEEVFVVVGIGTAEDLDIAVFLIGHVRGSPYSSPAAALAASASALRRALRCLAWKVLSAARFSSGVL